MAWRFARCTVFSFLRTAARVDGVGEIRPDVDSGKTYERLLVSPTRAMELLSWGTVGHAQIMAAVDVAKRVLGICEFSEKEEYI